MSFRNHFLSDSLRNLRIVVLLKRIIDCVNLIQNRNDLISLGIAHLRFLHHFVESSAFKGYIINVLVQHHPYFHDDRELLSGCKCLLCHCVLEKLMLANIRNGNDINTVCNVALFSGKGLSIVQLCEQHPNLFRRNVLIVVDRQVIILDCILKLFGKVFKVFAFKPFRLLIAFCISICNLRNANQVILVLDETTNSVDALLAIEEIICSSINLLCVKRRYRISFHQGMDQVALPCLFPYIGSLDDVVETECSVSCHFRDLLTTPCNVCFVKCHFFILLCLICFVFFVYYLSM